MEEELHTHIISQHEAITRIAKAVRKSRAGLKDPKRPMGSFIFAGPTGVGKTLLAKRLAHFMFGDENALVQIDMSEYMEKHNVSRLIGAPPGYIGYEEGGQLTEKIRRRPYSVVLFDEIEKAHEDVWNILLQVMEEGRLTDNVGRPVDFKNIILIMTTNIGSRKIAGEVGFGFRSASRESRVENIKSVVMDELKKEGSFKPEFLNRLDDVVVFQPLEAEDLKQIINVELEKLTKRLKEKNLALILTDEAKEFIIANGSSREFGARPLRRAVEQHIENPLSEKLLMGTFEGKEAIIGDVKVWFKLTPRNLELIAEMPGVARDLRAKLEPLAGRAFLSRQEFLDELAKVLTPEERTKYEALIVRTAKERTWVKITEETFNSLRGGTDPVPDAVLLRLERFLDQMLTEDEFERLLQSTLSKDDRINFKDRILEFAKHEPQIEFTSPGGAGVGELVSAGEGR
jgi:SpoVK/Ycf46/Vps4 family AAA+-type ATPase